MTWLSIEQIPKPNFGDFPTLADYMLACGTDATLRAASLNLLRAAPDAQYASPAAYLQAMTAYAKSLLENRFPIPYAPPGWDPTAAARSAIMKFLTTLGELPVNAGDPNTVSILNAWITGTGQLYGGHLVEPATTGNGVNTSTGQDAVVGPSIL